MHTKMSHNYEDKIRSKKYERFKGKLNKNDNIQIRKKHKKVVNKITTYLNMYKAMGLKKPK